MAFTPAPGTIQVNLRYDLLGEKIENTLYFKKQTGDPTLVEMEAIAAVLRGQWWATMRPVLVDDLSLREIYLTDISSVDGPTITYTQNLPSAGALTSDPLPNNCALCVSFRTNYRGRSFRGRNYVAGIPEGSVNGNTVDTGTVDTIVQAYEILIDPANLPVDYYWSTVSRFSNGVRRTEADVRFIQQVLVVDNVIDSQRRRLPGRGQ